MWVYFNNLDNSGSLAVKKTLTHGMPARVGNVGSFYIFCYVQGVVDDFFNATLTLKNPLGVTVSNEAILGKKETRQFKLKVGESASGVYPFIVGQSYVGYTFYFEHSAILNVGGTWTANVSYYGQNEINYVTQSFSFDVQKGAFDLNDTTDITLSQYQAILSQLSNITGRLPKTISIAYNLVVNSNQSQFGGDSGDYYFKEIDYPNYTVKQLFYRENAVTDLDTIREYLWHITGNETIPVYNLNKPNDAYVVSISNETVWKLQYNEGVGLLAFKVENFPFPFKSVTDNLNEEVEQLKIHLKFNDLLSFWDCKQGRATTWFGDKPYTYKNGDYFVVAVIAPNSEFDMPNGTTYNPLNLNTKKVFISTIEVNDVFIYKNGEWLYKKPTDEGYPVELFDVSMEKWGQVYQGEENGVEDQAIVPLRKTSVLDENNVGYYILQKDGDKWKQISFRPNGDIVINAGNHDITLESDTYLQGHDLKNIDGLEGIDHNIGGIDYDSIKLKSDLMLGKYDGHNYYLLFSNNDCVMQLRVNDDLTNNVDVFMPLKSGTLALLEDIDKSSIVANGNKNLNSEISTSKLEYTLVGGGNIEGRPQGYGDGTLLHMGWNNTNGWNTQIYVSNDNDALCYRSQDGHTWREWKKVATEDEVVKKSDVITEMLSTDDPDGNKKIPTNQAIKLKLNDCVKYKNRPTTPQTITAINDDETQTMYHHFTHTGFQVNKGKDPKGKTLPNTEQSNDGFFATEVNGWGAKYGAKFIDRITPSKTYRLEIPQEDGTLATQNYVQEVANGKCKSYVTALIHLDGNTGLQSTNDKNSLIGQQTGMPNVAISEDSEGFVVSERYLGLPYNKETLSTSFEYEENDILDLTTLNIGDILLVLDTDYPDYWYGGKIENMYVFFKLETTKVDLTNYATQSYVQNSKTAIKDGNNVVKEIAVKNNYEQDEHIVKTNSGGAIQAYIGRFENVGAVNVYPRGGTEINHNLGSKDNRFTYGYITNIVNTNIASSTTKTETLMPRDGMSIVYFGSASGENYFIPGLNNKHHLGNQTHKWKNIYTYKMTFADGTEITTAKILHELVYDGTNIKDEDGDVLTFADIKALLDSPKDYVYINDLTNHCMLNYGAYEDDALWFNSRYKIAGSNHLVRLIINDSNEIQYNDDELLVQHIINVNATTSAGTYHCQFQFNAPYSTNFTTTGTIAHYLYNINPALRLNASGTYVANGVKHLVTGISTKTNGTQKELVFEMVKLSDGSDVTISSYGLEIVDTII